MMHWSLPANGVGNHMRNRQFLSMSLNASTLVDTQLMVVMLRLHSSLSVGLCFKLVKLWVERSQMNKVKSSLLFRDQTI